MKKNFWIYIGLLFAMLVWSLSYVLVKIAYSYNVTPTILVFMRLVMASITLFIFSKISKNLQKISKKDRVLFLLLAFFEPFLYYIGESNGLLYVSPTTGSVIISTIPVFTPFAMFLFFKEKIDKTNFFGIIISFLGVLLVVLNENYSLSVSPKGLGFLFFAVASALGYSAVIRNLTKKYNSITIVTAQMGLGAIFYVPLMFISGINKIQNIELAWQMFAAIGGLAIFATGIGYILFSSGVREIGVVKSSIFANLIPALTAIFAFASGMENFPLRKVGGVAIVIIGIFLSQSKKHFLGIPGLVVNYVLRKNNKKNKF